MKNLKYYILGALSILLFIPIVEQLCEIIITGLEYVKGVVSKPVMKVNKELLDLQAEQEPISTHAIGFEIPPTELDDDELEDKSKTKIKCGFGSN